MARGVTRPARAVVKLLRTAGTAGCRLLLGTVGELVLWLVTLLVVRPVFDLLVAFERLQKTGRLGHEPVSCVMPDSETAAEEEGAADAAPSSAPANGRPAPAPTPPARPLPPPGPAADSTVRVLLWAPPRSLSTAFERCISALGERVQICHELYTAACHIGPENQVAIPVLESVVRDRRYSYAWVQKVLEAPAPTPRRIFFGKELAYSVDGRFDRLPAGYRHTFLVRHPARVFLSMNALVKRYFARNFLRLRLDQVLPKGLVYEEMYRLYRHVTEELGQSPIVIDADDLLQDPLGVLRAYCRAVGIPFSPSMNRWRPIKEEKRSWLYSSRLMVINKVIGQYDRAFQTSGLEPHVDRPIDLSHVTPEVLDATAASIGYYEKMYAQRLRPEPPPAPGLAGAGAADGPTPAGEDGAPAPGLLDELETTVKPAPKSKANGECVPVYMSKVAMYTMANII